MRWITTAGGPLVLVPEDALPLWQGAAGDEYAMACAVDDYAAVLHWQDRSVVVLGDEPLETSIWTEARMPTIARWMHAPSEGAVIECLRSGKFGAPIENLDFEPNGSTYVLFDSASPGRSVSNAPKIEFKARRYAVRTFRVTPDDEVALIVHVFEP